MLAQATVVHVAPHMPLHGLNQPAAVRNHRCAVQRLGLYTSLGVCDSSQRVRA